VFWFIALVITGRIDSPKFEYCGQQVHLTHEGYQLLFTEKALMKIAFQSGVDPTEVYKLFLEILKDMVT
jgi:hypothetical protein